jgi:hypothetical protein
MAYEDDDAYEFIGTDSKIKAAPVKSNASTPVAATAPAAELAQPEKPKSGSHPKHAIVRLSKAYAAATAETEAARIDYQAATFAYREAEKAEGVAVAAWITLNPPPTADEVYRAHVQRSQDERAARVARGEPGGIVKPSYGNSVVDRQAAQRPRQTPQMASAPLRSPVTRRVI